MLDGLKAEWFKFHAVGYRWIPMDIVMLLSEISARRMVEFYNYRRRGNCPWVSFEEVGTQKPNGQDLSSHNYGFSVRCLKDAE